MKLIKPSVKLIEESNPFKKIEFIGRTCYKSTSEMTEESAKKFFNNLVNREHTAMVEHATFVFQVSEDFYNDLQGHRYFNYTANNNRFLISGNLRALNESKEESLLRALYDCYPQLIYAKDLPRPIESVPHFYEGVAIIDFLSLDNITEEEFNSHAYFSFHFICDRGVSHEIVRHRPASFAQESTRYCNYSQDKFGNELTFIEPANFMAWSKRLKETFARSLVICENQYMDMLREKATPEIARAVLNNALKTEVIMTTNAGEFEHFFDLRSRALTGAPHPDMKVVADMALDIFEKKKSEIL